MSVTLKSTEAGHFGTTFGEEGLVPGASCYAVCGWLELLPAD